MNYRYNNLQQNTLNNILLYHYLMSEPHKPHNLEKYSLEDLQNYLNSSKSNTNNKSTNTANKNAPNTGSELSKIPPMSIVKGIYEKQKAIYGVDDRKDLYEVFNERYLKAADSVVALFTIDQITDNGDGTSKLSLDNFGKAYNLCSDEKFRDQPIGAFCSGFLVASDKIATAGHCVMHNGSNDGKKLEDIRFVFGFRMNGPGEPTTIIKNSEIYKGTSILGWEKKDDGADYAVIKLDHQVENHTPVRVRKKEKIEDNASLYVIGCPCGLPMKFADGAEVRDNDPPTHMVCNLDTYGGNSGSPVFLDEIDDNESPLVEGILVRGERDFKTVGNCDVSLVCPTTGCRGEDVTRTTIFAHLIDKE